MQYAILLQPPSLRNHKHPNSDWLNTLRSQLGEILMVGNSLYNVQINNRLKDIKGGKADFGGVSIIAIGGMFQLKPVTDGFVFKDFDNTEYGILIPNLWKQHFTRFEQEEIMRRKSY